MESLHWHSQTLIICIFTTTISIVYSVHHGFQTWAVNTHTWCKMTFHRKSTALQFMTQQQYFDFFILLLLGVWTLIKCFLRYVKINQTCNLGVWQRKVWEWLVYKKELLVWTSLDLNGHICWLIIVAKSLHLFGLAWNEMVISARKQNLTCLDWFGLE